MEVHSYSLYVLNLFFYFPDLNIFISLSAPPLTIILGSDQLQQRTCSEWPFRSNNFYFEMEMPEKTQFGNPSGMVIELLFQIIMGLPGAFFVIKKYFILQRYLSWRRIAL